MLVLSALILLTVVISLRVKKVLFTRLDKQQDSFDVKKAEYENFKEQHSRLEADNFALEKSLSHTIALYEITKDICKTLDENKVFAIFKERIAQYVEIGSCELVKNEEADKYKDYLMLPLAINKNITGYLATKGLRAQDEDKFYILTQQFLLGIKRALLYKKVQELTVSDSLTGAFSRRYFLERSAEELERSKRLRLKLSFLIVDVDHFKGYNDHYGHLVGDAILKEVSGRIKENIRQIDFMGKYGGDEFGIILTETDKEQARFVAERIRTAIESAQIKIYDEDLKITISIGVAGFLDDASDVEALVEKADQALYQAKQAGRNKVCLA